MRIKYKFMINYLICIVNSAKGKSQTIRIMTSKKDSPPIAQRDIPANIKMIAKVLQHQSANSLEGRKSSFSLFQELFPFPSFPEEALHDFRAFLLQHPSPDFWPVIQRLIAGNVEH